jgi:hypothetical protein
MDDSGLIVTAPADAPRFDHRYVNGEIESLGLLVEEQRSNSLYYSNDFSQDPLPATAVQGWFKQNSHPVPTQSVVGPDGVSNSGWRFYRTATDQYIYQQIVGAGTHTLSAWVRSSAATGSFTMQGYNSTDNGMSQQFTATNEWQRFSITISPTTTTNYYPCIPTNINTDFYVWGAQLELNGSFPTSYIPTSGGTATREPDIVSMEGDNFSDWYNQSEGSIFMQSSLLDVGNTGGKVLWSINQDGGFGEGFYMVNENNQTSITINAFYGGSSQAQFGGPTGITTNQYHKIIFSYQENNVNACFDGTLGIADTSVGIATVGRLVIGNNAWGNILNPGDCHISQFTYYPTRLTNAQLQTLTK